MRKTLVYALIFLFIPIILISCANKKGVISKNTVEKELKPVEIKESARKCLKEAPTWVISKEKGVYPGYFTAVGSARIYYNNYQIAYDKALHTAKANLISNVKTFIEKIVKNYFSQHGIKNMVSQRGLFEELSKEVVSSNLRNVEVLDKWISPCDDMFIIVGVPNGEVINAGKAYVRKLEDREEIKTRARVKLLEEELEKALKEKGKEIKAYE